MDNTLTATLKIVLANTFVMYFKAHSYHWNVEGKDFPQYHDFFGDLYEELFGAIDVLAEHIRILDVYAPISLNDLYSNKTIIEDTIKPASCQYMIISLIESNKEVIETLNKCFELADEAKEQGLADFISGRLDIHKKHAWMLKSSSKSFGE
jgi:starvation-inducible DNA-binding protein